MTGRAAVTIEPLRWWHVDAVHRLEQRLFPADAWSVEQFWSELAQPTRSYRVAMQEGTVVGYAGLFVLPPDADVQTIAVGTDAQGQGIGRRLLESLIDDAESRGVTHTLLEVRSDNESARALYQRLGFVRISERRRYYPDGQDALIMRRARADAQGVRHEH